MSLILFKKVCRVNLLALTVLLFPTLGSAYELQFAPDAEQSVAEDSNGNIGVEFTLVRTPEDTSGTNVPESCQFQLTPAVLSTSTAEQTQDWNFDEDRLTQTISPADDATVTFSGYISIESDDDIEDTETILLGAPEIVSDNCNVTLAPEWNAEPGPQYTFNIVDDDRDPAMLQIVSGNNQSGDETTTLEALVVAVLDENGEPASGAEIRFSINSGDGFIATEQAAESGANEATVISDENGQAEVFLTLNSDASAQVEATILQSNVPSLTFDINAGNDTDESDEDGDGDGDEDGETGGGEETGQEESEPASIQITSGDNQNSGQNSGFDALEVIVSDDSGEPIAGAEVVFSIVNGDGFVAADNNANSGASEITITTDDSGRAQAFVSLATDSPALVEVSVAQSNVPSVTFSVNSNAELVGSVNIIGGENPTGGPDDTLDPVVIEAFQANGDPAQGALIEWTVSPAGAAQVCRNQPGSPQVCGESVVTATDQTGQTEVELQLLTEQRAVLTATPVAGGPSAVLLVNGGFAANIPGLNPTEQSLTNSLNNACSALSEQANERTAEEQDLLNTCEGLLETTDTQAANIIESLSPDELAAQADLSITIANQQVSGVTNRLNALRTGGSGLGGSGGSAVGAGGNVDFSALNFNYNGQSLPVAPLVQYMIEDETTGSGAGDTSGLVTPWGFFINGDISFGERDQTSNESGFGFSIPILTAGLDYRINSETIVGAALGYSDAAADFDGNSGNLDVQSIALSVFGTWYQGKGIYVDGLFKFSSNDYDMSRNISASQALLGNTDGTEYSVNVSAGYNGYRGATSFGGYGRASFVNIDIDGYTETASNPSGAGAGSVLMIGDQQTESMTAVLGARLSHNFSRESGIFIPQLQLEWEHQFEDNAREISAQFVYDPTNTGFSVLTGDPDRDYLNLSVGFSVISTGGKFGFLNFETKINQDNVTQSSINGGLRFEF